MALPDVDATPAGKGDDADAACDTDTVGRPTVGAAHATDPTDGPIDS
jgi:hypothetical protein